jgi:hypothetical protein
VRFADRVVTLEAGRIVGEHRRVALAEEIVA